MTDMGTPGELDATIVVPGVGIAMDGELDTLVAVGRAPRGAPGTPLETGVVTAIWP